MTTMEESKCQTEEIKFECDSEAVDKNDLIKMEDKVPDVGPAEEKFIKIEMKPKIGPVVKDVRETREMELPEFKFGGYIKLARRKEVYGVEFFNHLRSNELVIFATVGYKNATIYECKHEEMEVLQTYLDHGDTFYTCCWTHSPNTLHAILVFGGAYGIIRLIHPMSALAPQTLIGHTLGIHDLKVHPKDPSILLSASGDHTLRLWNIESELCITVFGGVMGHTDQIVSADFDSTGSKIVSGGGDYSLKIWRLDRWPINKLIESSFSVSIGNDRPFRTVTIHYPDFTTTSVHHNIVDCVKWFGSSILSKATENVIICWTPEPVTAKPNHLKVNYATTVLRFDIEACNYWYMRFALDPAKKFMAIGNTIGDIYVWSLNNEDPTKSIILRHEKCTSTIRQTAFSPDGKILLAVADDGKVFRWNMK